MKSLIVAAALLVSVAAFLVAVAVANAQQINPDQAAYDINKNAVMLSEILKAQVQNVSNLQAQLKEAQAHVCPPAEPKKPDDKP
jgi:hypothetical protein